MRQRVIAALALAGLFTPLTAVVRDMRAAAVRRVAGPLLAEGPRGAG